MRNSIFADPAPETAEQYGKLKIARYEEDSYRQPGKKIIAVKMWSGKQSKPYAHFTFRSVEHRELYIQEQKDNHDANEKYAERRKVERAQELEKAKAEIQVGTILHYSWGWEQTNAEFWQVIARKGSTVQIREIGHRTVAGSEGFMSCRVMPDRDKFISETVLTKRIGAYGITMKHGTASPCSDNSTHYSSWYA